ncbi:MAG: lipase family protein, partial [Clostridia bacterium]|nr:lipase family protein [Clostridia bacterium]
MKRTISFLAALLFAFSYPGFTYFTFASEVYNHEDARAAIEFALAAYGGDEAITAKLQEFGYDTICTYNYDDSYNENSSAFALALHGREAVLVICGTRSEEWLGNFNIGDNEITDTHYSFSAAADEVLLKTEKYLEEHATIPEKLIVTGHSRGAAVANLVAARMDDGKCDGVTRDTLCAYTYATPTVTLTDETNSERYNNIFNIVNTEDLVTLVPLPRWGYKRYGIDIFLPTLANDENYLNYKSRMIQKYSELFGTAPDMFDSMSSAEAADAIYALCPNVDTYYNKEYYFNERVGNITVREFCAKVAAVMVDSSDADAQSMILSGLGNDFRQISRYLINNTELIAAVHRTEAYLAWMNSLSEDELFEGRGSKAVSIISRDNVQINLKNEDGEVLALVSMIKNKKPSLTLQVAASTGVEFVSLYLPESLMCEAEISSEGDASFSLSLSFLTGTAIASRRVNYFGVPIKSGEPARFNTVTFFDGILPCEDFLPSVNYEA